MGRKMFLGTLSSSSAIEIILHPTGQAGAWRSRAAKPSIIKTFSIPIFLSPSYSCQRKAEHQLDSLFTFYKFVDMSTSTVSARLDDKEIAELDALTQLAGFDRSAVLKSIFRKGIRDWRFELAVQKYRAEEATLSRAAEISGISQWDFIARMDTSGLELHYDAEDLEEDLKALED
jgi:predicted HTH domain antitoxin